MKRQNDKSIFPAAKIYNAEEPRQPNVNRFKIESFETLNWSRLGQLIIEMYEHFTAIDDVTGISHTFAADELILKNVTEETPVVCEPEERIDEENETENNPDIEMSEAEQTTDPKENSDSNADSTKGANLDAQGTNSADASADDSDANIKDGNNSDSTSSKPKHSRRRGSDLQFLEQWCFWDRNRKYSQRQKNKAEKNEVDTSINGVLRKVLPKYFE